MTDQEKDSSRREQLDALFEEYGDKVLAALPAKPAEIVEAVPEVPAENVYDMVWRLRHRRGLNVQKIKGTWTVDGVLPEESESDPQPAPKQTRKNGAVKTSQTDPQPVDADELADRTRTKEGIPATTAA